MAVTRKPHGLAEIATRGNESRAWLLIDGAYVEVTDVCCHIELAADVGSLSTLVLRISAAASGRPGDEGESAWTSRTDNLT